MAIASTERSYGWNLPKTLALAALWTVLSAVRLALITLLVILEPFVTIALMGIATLGVLTCLFYEFLIRAPHFPFWLMLSFSLGSAMLLLLYYALMRVLAGGRA